MAQKMMKSWPHFLRHEHSPSAISQRLSTRNSSHGIRDLVYGAIDGTVTTFSIVAGVSGADLPNSVILILGISNVISDGFSMASGNYLGTKAELDQNKLIKEFESEQINVNPKGEEEEIRQIFMSKGFEGELLEEAVRVIIKDRGEWLQLMLAEEYGIGQSNKSPLKAATITFLAFVTFGMIPLIPYVLGINNDFVIATVLTGSSFFLLGVMKSLWSLESAWFSGLKTFIIGSIAAGLAYLVGVFLKDLVS